jgi:hypothetical protein
MSTVDDRAPIRTRRKRSLQRFARLRTELEAAMERRTAIWAECSRAGRPAGRDVADLDQRIETMWRELRVARAEAVAAPRERIVAGARAQERVYRELDRRLARSVTPVR